MNLVNTRYTAINMNKANLLPDCILSAADGGELTAILPTYKTIKDMTQKTNNGNCKLFVPSTMENKQPLEIINNLLSQLKHNYDYSINKFSYFSTLSKNPLILGLTAATPAAIHFFIGQPSQITAKDLQNNNTTNNGFNLHWLQPLITCGLVLGYFVGDFVSKKIYKNKTDFFAMSTHIFSNIKQELIQFKTKIKNDESEDYKQLIGIIDALIKFTNDIDVFIAAQFSNPKKDHREIDFKQFHQTTLALCNIIILLGEINNLTNKLTQ